MKKTRGRRDATDPEFVEGGNAQMTDQTPVDPTPAATPVDPSPPADPAPTSAPPASAPPASTTWTPPASAGSASAARPTGITILAILAGIGGVLGLLGGFALFLGGTVLFGAAGALFGLAALALAALSLAFSWGAWTLQPWAWPLGVVLAAGSIIYALVLILGGSSIISQGITIVLYGAVLYYLNQPGIKSLFGRA